jgi:hypothetical protein
LVCPAGTHTHKKIKQINIKNEEKIELGFKLELVGRRAGSGGWAD